MIAVSATLPIWRQLAWLRGQRRRFRIRRAMQRMLSPRRIIASSLTVLFVIAYLLNGAYILSARQPADPARLMLWLSGGMVIYALYYSVRCAWSQPNQGLDLTAAEQLWLGGAPVSATTLAVNHVAGLAPAAMAKTMLLTVVLARDVNHIELLVAGTFCSLLLLEIVRLIIARWSGGLQHDQRWGFRWATTAWAGAAVALAITTILARTPLYSETWVYVLNAFQALGTVAANEAIQWLSIPWSAAAQLVVTDHYSWNTLIQFIVAAAAIPLATGVLVYTDRWSQRQVHRQEQQRLERGEVARDPQTDVADTCLSLSGSHDWIYRWAPLATHGVLSIAARHWVSVRRYWLTILGSFLMPTLLCLSPLATGESRDQWLYIVCGVAICTMLLAPPALKIDFRRDLRRMLLVRSLPVGSLEMVLGTLLAPVSITCVFQLFTLLIGAWATSTPAHQLLLWTALMNALAVFTFAGENALFLAYPHHEKAEGIGMMIRAKLTFLGKGTVMAAALTLLVLWALACRRLPESWSQPIFISGAIAAAWAAALSALAATTFCWRRFDLSIDIPPQ